MNICDPSIFDNSDIFIGDNGVVVPESRQVVKELNNYADIDEESLCQSHLLTVLNNWCPSGREAEERWKYSEQSQKWHQSWTFLQNLTTEGYILLYGSFPSPFLAREPTRDKPKEVYDNFRDAYRLDALWTLKLVNFDIPKPDILDAPRVKERETFGQLNQAELLLCQAYLNHEKCRWVFRSMFRHEANLWFWLQVARCKHGCQKHGLTERLHPSQIGIKGDLTKEWGQDLARIAGEETTKPKNYIKLGDCSDFLTKLPTLFYSEVRSIASNDLDFRDGPLAAYEAISHAARNKINRSGDYQTEFLYHPFGSEEVESYRTGRTNKRPTSKSRRKKGFGG